MTTKTLPEARPSRFQYIDRTRELKWLAQHRQQYLGQWVLLMGDQLISSGADPAPLVKAARAQGIERPLVVHVTESVDMGGWL